MCGANVVRACMSRASEASGRVIKGTEIRTQGWEGAAYNSPVHILQTTTCGDIYSHRAVQNRLLYTTAKYKILLHTSPPLPLPLRHAASSMQPWTERNVYMYAPATAYATWQTVQPGPNHPLSSAHLACSCKSAPFFATVYHPFLQDGRSSSK